MKAYARKRLILFLFLLLFCISLQALIEERSRVSVLKEDTCCQDDFRAQHLTPKLYEELESRAENGESFADLLTVTMLCGDFFPDKIFADREAFLKYKPKEYSFLKKCYEAVWADLSCFPIPSRDISYENTFGEPRTFAGERLHEGTDLFGKETASGYYPILSMTDGYIEKIGWLPLGGYRVGIRAPSGGYYYYAHLSEYEKDFQIGEKVQAGDILGFMGDTGYGEEGTVGAFPVHLHLGIYICTANFEELSVNPYWILKAAQKKIRKYTY